MAPVGVMILFHPAIILLLIGISLVTSGFSWLLLFRNFSRRNRILCFIAVFVVSSLFYSLIFGLVYMSPIVRVEIINGL